MKLQLVTVKENKMRKELKIYLGILAFTAFALALSDGIISNYLNDAYHVTTKQRGMIEFPRELPGMICIFAISILSFLSDIKIAMIAQILSVIGITVLGFFTPVFSVMLIFLFINSLGMHLFFPLQDSIGLSLIKDGKYGKRMGQFKGVFTGFQMLGAAVIFIGFKNGIFSFETRIKPTFVIAGILFLIVFLLFLILNKLLHNPDIKHQKMKFIFRKEYKYYYILVIMFGVQKQIMIVYGPWVLINLLNKKADTIGLLSIIGAFIGIFFIPLIGRGLDKLGIKKMLYADALSFIGVYLIYGFLSGGYSSGLIPKTGLPVLYAYIIFILDRMSTQMGIVRTVYLKSIAVKDTDLTPTLSLGISMDHIVSITCAYLGGVIWTVWGPQYIFYLAAAMSLVNFYVAVKVKPAN